MCHGKVSEDMWDQKIGLHPRCMVEPRTRQMKMSERMSNNASILDKVLGYVSDKHIRFQVRWYCPNTFQIQYRVRKSCMPEATRRLDITLISMFEHMSDERVCTYNVCTYPHIRIHVTGQNLCHLKLLEPMAVRPDVRMWDHTQMTNDKPIRGLLTWSTFSLKNVGRMVLKRIVGRTCIKPVEPVRHEEAPSTGICSNWKWNFH